jgi:YVTN family beta-propeller protein
MLALYRAGRQADALDVYQDARRTLVDELGLEPGPDLQELQRQILAHDPALAGPRRNARLAARRRRGGLLIIAGGVILLAAAIAAGTLELTSDGTRTLSRVAPNSVGVIDPNTNRIVAQIPLGVTPTRVSAGRDALWVVNQGDATLSRVDYRTHAVHTISVPDTPAALAASNEAVWLLSGQQGGNGSDPFAGPAEVSKISESPSLSVLTTIPVGSPVGNTFEDTIAVDGQTVWVSDPGTLSKIKAASARVAAHYQVGSAVNTPAGLAIADQSIWVLDNDGLYRVDPGSGAVIAQIQAGAIPTALAIGPEAIWVVSRPGYIYQAGPPKQIGHATLTRIDPSSNTVNSTIQLPGSPTGVAVGEHYVWISDDSNQTILKVNPRTNRITNTIHLGSRPEGIAVADRNIWVATH